MNALRITGWTCSGQFSSCAVNKPLGLGFGLRHARVTSCCIAAVYRDSYGIRNIHEISYG